MASTDGFAFDAPVDDGLLDAVHELLARVWAVHPDVDQADRDLLATALVEIAGNVIEHAASATQACVTVVVTADEVRAELVDDGAQLPATVVEDATWPDDPLATEGRGIALARDAVDDLAYRRDGDRNRWTFVRRRSRPA